MACLTVSYRRIGGELKVTYAPVCNTSAGVYYLVDKSGRFLTDKNGNYLTVKRINHG